MLDRQLPVALVERQLEIGFDRKVALALTRPPGRLCISQTYESTPAYSGRGGTSQVGLFSRLPSAPVYNTRAVVQRTGVPADTFRAWERRYGLPMPARTAGNHRLYSDRDIATIAWLRDQTEAGLTISQAVRLFRQRAGDVPATDITLPLSEQTPDDDPDPRMSRFAAEAVEALVGYDALAASRVIEEALALLPLEEVCLHVLQPALYEIGRRWERGEVEVSAEHFASAFVIRRLGALFNLSQPEAGRGPVVAACLEGELHEIGLLLTCLFLSRRGVKILYLGPNLHWTT
jgi:DNA-binding transcriptional MerR regulator